MVSKRMLAGLSPRRMCGQGLSWGLAAGRRASGLDQDPGHLRSRGASQSKGIRQASSDPSSATSLLCGLGQVT